MDRWSSLNELSDLFRLQAKAWAQEWARTTMDGLTITEAAVLDVLAREGSQQPTNLASALLITTGGVTGIADKLLQKGLILRSRDEKDRRVVYLSITDRGMEVHQSTVKGRQERLQTAMQVLDDSEVENLLHIYRKLTNGLTHKTVVDPVQTNRE